MKTPAPTDLQRWSEELARNPASLAFLPLARAYRRLGRRDLAVQLCMRGMEHHPTHVEAHALLALLHFESGDRAKAADEWATVLRLKPGNFEALRGMGFRYLEQGEIAKARNHLERASLIRPEDTTVQEALRLIRQRELAIGKAPPAAAESPRVATVSTPESPEASSPERPDERVEAAVRARAGEPPWRPAPKPEAPEPRVHRSPAEAAQRTASGSRFMPAGAAPQQARPAPPQQARSAPQQWAGDPTLPADPTRLFEEMASSGPLLGILLLDRRGLVLAGALRDGADGASEELGALIGAAIQEAVRTIEHLRLGAWKTLTLECAGAAMQVAPVGESAMVVVAARRGAPMGWVARSAYHAVGIAERFMEAYA
jgi:tetratricopeptide (TPR) repeat protein